MGSIEDALAEMESLKPGESPNYTRIANKRDVVRSTLTRRHQAATTSRATNALNQQKLSKQQERELIHYI